jgi:flagellar biosynthesis protein FliO
MNSLGRLALAVLFIGAQGVAASADPVAELIAGREAGRPAETQPSRPESAAGALPASAAARMPVPSAPDETAAPSLGMAASRVLGATAVVGVLLTLTLLVLRWLFRHAGRAPGSSGLFRGLAGRTGWRSLWRPATPSPADRLEILERSPVGMKESVCVVRAGSERFLIGVTSTQISLLGRLHPSPDLAPAAADQRDERVEEPAGADFARGLAELASARPDVGDGSFRDLLARSRERLTRLGVHAGHRDA